MVITEAIYLNVIRSVVVQRLGRMAINAILSVLQGYGNFEKASIAANNLKIICPKLYWVLYFNKVEMLYFIVEPKLKGAVYLLSETTIDDRKWRYYEEKVARVLADIIDN
ncbi:hypothetical protein ACSLVK_14270 [Photorhabdus tasmaniensis]|uniref:hypothetical protein n=1 Tax=Photorhabdus tasmaniensis TaxID=1004159 RepID=UPI0040410D20